MDIDDIFDQAKSVVNTAAKKVGEVVDVSKLKFETAKHSNAATELYEKLGRTVYEGKKNGYDNDEIISAICLEIDEKNKAIDDLTSEIASRKNQTICAACGSKNCKENCFCSKCGAKIKDEDEECTCDDEPDFTDVVKEKAEDFAKKAKDIGEDVREKAKDFAEDFKEKHMAGEDVSDFVEAKVHDVRDRVEDVAEDVADKVHDVASSAKEKAADAAADAADAAETVKDTAEDIKDDLNK